MKVMKTTKTLSLVAGASLLAILSTACSDGDNNANLGRVRNFHEELKIIPPDTNSLGVSTQAAVSIGSLFLESQIAPQTVEGTQLQASDLNFNGTDGYISYNAVDNGSNPIKKGAIEHFHPAICDNPFTLGIEFCLVPRKTLQIPNTEIFSSFSDGSNLYAVGSTLDESAAPHFGRLYKIGLDASKDPTLISATAIVPSYAGTGVIVRGTRVITTSGMRTSSVTENGMPTGGGLSFYNTNLDYLTTFPLYDARAVSFNAAESSVYVTRAQGGGPTASSIVKVNADGSGSPTTVATINGNTTPESKSDLAVGNTLIIASTGEGGFAVLCKATGALLRTVPAVTVAGIPAAKTVTNSVAAVPGHIFAANGEGGVHVYSFQKINPLLSTCATNNIKVTLLGRLSLGASSSYVNAELSANSVKAMTVTNLLGLGLITTRFIMVASGNKGVSMINASAITVSLGLDIDDF